MDLARLRGQIDDQHLQTNGAGKMCLDRWHALVMLGLVSAAFGLFAMALRVGRETAPGIKYSLGSLCCIALGVAIHELPGEIPSDWGRWLQMVMIFSLGIIVGTLASKSKQQLAGAKSKS